MKLNVKAAAGAFGLVMGLEMLTLIGWLGMRKKKGGWDTARRTLAEIYPGVDLTAKGALAGLGWAVLDGAKMGLAYALIYNLLAGEEE
jgi:hypothetical protein